MDAPFDPRDNKANIQLSNKLAEGFSKEQHQDKKEEIVRKEEYQDANKDKEGEEAQIHHQLKIDGHQRNV